MRLRIGIIIEIWGKTGGRIEIIVLRVIVIVTIVHVVIVILRVYERDQLLILCCADTETLQ